MIHHSVWTLVLASLPNDEALGRQMREREGRGSAPTGERVDWVRVDLENYGGSGQEIVRIRASIS